MNCQQQPHRWALLNLMLPDVFPSSEKFDDCFNISRRLLDKTMLDRAHWLLQPFQLRRLKIEVRDEYPLIKGGFVHFGIRHKKTSCSSASNSAPLAAMLPGFSFCGGRSQGSPIIGPLPLMMSNVMVSRQVEKDLPPKVEHKIYCPLTDMQVCRYHVVYSD